VKHNAIHKGIAECNSCQEMCKKKKTAGSSKGLEISPRSLQKIVQQMVGLVPNVLLTFIKQPILHIYLGI
jgi:hypothetical protein